MITGVNAFRPVLRVLPDQAALENLFCSTIIWLEFVKLSHGNIFSIKSSFSNEISISPLKSQKLHFDSKLLKIWKTKVWSAICHPPPLCWNTLRERVLPWSYKICNHSSESALLGEKIFKQSITFLFGIFKQKTWQNLNSCTSGKLSFSHLISEMTFAKSAPLSDSSTWLMLQFSEAANWKQTSYSWNRHFTNTAAPVL